MWNLVMGALVSSEDDEGIVGHPDPDDEPQKAPLPPEMSGSPAPTTGDSERQQGDGMEVPTSRKPTVDDAVKASAADILSLLPPSPAPANLLPDTSLSLTKLPPIMDKVELLPHLPNAPLVLEKPKVYPKGRFPPGVKKNREPKFVPYEPYKGAVTSFTDKYVGRKSPEKKLDLSKVSASDLSTDDVENGEEESFGNGDPATAEARQRISSELESNYRMMLDAKEKELEQLRNALENSEKQVKIQTQVNSEVKRLLVASVGEDIEARVDFLTQDKARLAADVITYNNKISRDWEEKEALHVESDIWRSKFLASTLILEEVSRTKQNNEARCHQLEHASRRLLVERNEVRGLLATSQTIVAKLIASFDPLSRNNPLSSGLDIIRQAELLTKSCQTLCDRLVGDGPTRPENIPQIHHVDSPAEKELRKLLSHHHACSDSNIPEQASSSLTKGARSLLLKMGDKAQSPEKSEFSTCSHCNGSVQVV